MTVNQNAATNRVLRCKTYVLIEGGHIGISGSLLSFNDVENHQIIGKGNKYNN